MIKSDQSKSVATENIREKKFELAAVWTVLTHTYYYCDWHTTVSRLYTMYIVHAGLNVA